MSSLFHWKSRWVFLGQVIVCSDLSSDRTICNFDFAVIITVIIPFYVCTFHLIIKKKQSLPKDCKMKSRRIDKEEVTNRRMQFVLN